MSIVTSRSRTEVKKVDTKFRKPHCPPGKIGPNSMQALLSVTICTTHYLNHNMHKTLYIIAPREWKAGSSRHMGLVGIELTSFCSPCMPAYYHSTITIITH